MQTNIRESIDNLSAEAAVLVGVRLSTSKSDWLDPLGELRALAETAGARVVGELLQNLAKPRGKTYIGKGKVEELALMVKELGARIVIFDNELSPSQIQSLEEVTKCKVLDRSELILDIFANRATTREAQLQVEIAQLEYTAPRLRAMWSHLGQVTGGAPMGVGTRGPGEQQLEIDRRLVQARVGVLRRDLETILARKEREVLERRNEHFTAGIVGYTNAGKSTLFNRLTEGGAYVADRLFATLMTRVEAWNLGGGESVLVSDTVGFIRDLPHHLVASFRSTLADAVHAHVIFIVLDVSDRLAPAQLLTVREVLDDIGAKSQPRLLLLNKIDKIETLGYEAKQSLRTLEEWKALEPDSIAISSTLGTGLDELATWVRSHKGGSQVRHTLRVSLRDTRMIDAIERRTVVVAREYASDASGDYVECSADLGQHVLDELIATGARFMIDGVEARGSTAGWGTTRRTPPHLRNV